MRSLKNLVYEKILVLGMAKSGTSAAKLLDSCGKNVRVNDIKATAQDISVKELESRGVEVITGGHPLSVLEDIELLVKNPGIPYDNPIVKEAEIRGLPIITEVELASQLIDNPIIAITGSNGKTTTTTLIHEMLVHSSQNAKIAGNIGDVATEVASSMTPDDTMVIELSSFQLLGIQTFRPKISVLLNIFEAHLDYHKTFDNYKHAKANVFKNQLENDYLVYNYDDATVREMVADAKVTKVPFSLTEQLDNGAWCDQEHLYFKQEKIIDINNIALVGKHNLENILAAVSAAKLHGATTEAIGQVLSTFSGVTHRLQFVKNIQDRLFYNDSKATNILATSKALASFEQPTILLAGGLDRGNDFYDLIPYLDNVKAMVVFGETANKLEQTARKAGIDNVVFVDNVKHATQEAFKLSDRGDVILLSPACASWDQYRTFEERGDMFVDAVHTLK